MPERTVPITVAKAHLLRMATEVAASGEEVIITRHGRPLVKLVSARQPPSLLGSITFNCSLEEMTEPIGDWHEDFGESDPLFDNG